MPVHQLRYAPSAFSSYWLRCLAGNAISSKASLVLSPFYMLL
jgi:hypothetical protein